MKKPRIYYPGDLTLGVNTTLLADASHHILHVLRMKFGASLLVFNGRGKEYEAILTGVDAGLASLEILAERTPSCESPLNITLVQGVSKRERMEYVVQKAVELGVSKIIPVFTQRCEVKLHGDRLEKRLQHWRKIILSACEQSGRLKIPELLSPPTLGEFFQNPGEGLKLVLSPTAKKEKVLSAPSQVTLLVGPEGGFTDKEIELAGKAQFSPFSLGPRILRTETATVVALTLAQSLWGDLS